MSMTTRHLVLTGAGIVGAATATTSAISLYGIAVKCGIPEPWAVANPIALDAGAAVSALAWITQDRERRTWAKWTAVAALAASLVENGLDHALSLAEKAVTPAPLLVPLWLVLGVSACIPAMLFAVVHLAALMVRAEPAKPQVARAPRKTAPKLPTETLQPVPAETSPTVASLVRLDPPALTVMEQRVAWVQAQPQWPTVKAVMGQFGLKQSAAGRVLVAAKRAS